MKAPALQKKERRLIALVVALFALFLRLRAARTLPIDMDEFVYMRAAIKYASHLKTGDIKAIVNERTNYEHPPLIKILYGILLLAVQGWQRTRRLEEPNKDQPETSLELSRITFPIRTFNACIGALTAGALALQDTLAGLILACNTWHIKYSSEAMLEACPCFLSTLALLKLRRLKESDDQLEWQSALALGVSAASKHLYGVSSIPALAWIANRKRTWKLRLLYGCLMAAAFYIANPALWFKAGTISNSLNFHLNYANKNKIRGKNSWAKTFTLLFNSCFWHPYVFPINLDGFFSYIALFSLRSSWHKDRLVSLWFGTNFAFLLLWPTKWPQYVLTLTSSISLLAAESLRKFIKLLIF